MIRTIEKISRIDTQSMLHELHVKIALLNNERDIIDVKLDEAEMLELNSVLKRCLSIGNKRIKNIASLDTIAHVDLTKAEPPAIKKYFEDKFGVQDTFGKIIPTATPFFQGSTIVDTPNYYLDENKSGQMLVYPVFNTNKLNIVNPQIGKQISFNIKWFLKNCKSVVLPSGEIYITGGYNAENDTCSQDNYRIDVLKRSVESKQKMRVGRSSHGICSMDFNIYVCGGKKNDQGLLNSFERYDALEDKWELLPNCEFNTVRPLLVPFTLKNGA
jgi:Kelch motif